MITIFSIKGTKPDFCREGTSRLNIAQGFTGNEFIYPERIKAKDNLGGVWT